MNLFAKKIMCCVMLSILTLMSISCSTSIHGSLYKSKLVSKINQADKIVLTEHSDRLDFVHTQKGGLKKIPFYEYGRVILSKKQKESFSQIVSELKPKISNYNKACIFRHHHTIDFYSKGELSSRMEICFICDQVKWNATKYKNPESLISGLEKVIQDAGFKAKRDWSNLARNKKDIHEKSSHGR